MCSDKARRSVSLLGRGVLLAQVVNAKSDVTLQQPTEHVEEELFDLHRLVGDGGHSSTSQF